MFRTPSRSTAAGVALGSVGLAVGVVGSTPALLQLDASAAQAGTAHDRTFAGPDRAAVATAGDAPLDAWAFAALRPARQRVLPTATTPSRARRAVSRRPGPHRVAATRPAGRADRGARRRALPRDPQALARVMVRDRGWGESQWHCLDLLWTRESNWGVHETNASSGAYGIPQSLPAEKMARFGDDWRDNPATQIRWGLWYIADRYGSPCAAWEHSERYNFY